jgi:hypothetical protein
MGGNALSKLQCDNPECGRRFGYTGPGTYESGHAVNVGFYCTKVDLCNGCYATLSIGQLEAIARGIEGEKQLARGRAQAAREERAYQARRRVEYIEGDHLSSFPFM